MKYYAKIRVIMHKKGLIYNADGKIFNSAFILPFFT